MSDIKTFDTRVAGLSREADAIVEELAREVLIKRPDLVEFVMGMGGWHFTTERYLHYISDDYSPYEERKHMEALETFINEYDSIFKMTGSPMRFTAKGKKITNW